MGDDQAADAAMLYLLSEPPTPKGNSLNLKLCINLAWCPFAWLVLILYCFYGGKLLFYFALDYSSIDLDFSDDLLFYFGLKLGESRSLFMR